jgi:hypothetical protein
MAITIIITMGWAIVIIITIMEGKSRELFI